MKIWKYGAVLNFVSTLVLIGMQLYYEKQIVITEPIQLSQVQQPIIKTIETFEDLSIDENLPVIKKKSSEKRKNPPKLKLQKKIQKVQKKEEIEKASWYGAQFHGRKTAAGEKFDMYKLTAAHKSLPLGTWIKVYNLENDKSVILQINDRGPFIKGRSLDLSYAAARELGFLKKGVQKIKYEVL